MKQAWDDLKSFLTVAMVLLLYIVVIASLFGLNLTENLLILITNLITSVFTYYFARKSSEKENKVVIDETNKTEL